MLKNTQNYLHHRVGFFGWIVAALLLLAFTSCATHTNYVKDGGDFTADNAQCQQDILAAENANDANKPNELNTPKSLQYTNPYETCMVSKGWHPEKTEFRLNSLKMTW